MNAVLLCCVAVQRNVTTIEKLEARRHRAEGKPPPPSFDLQRGVLANMRQVMGEGNLAWWLVPVPPVLVAPHTLRPSR